MRSIQIMIIIKIYEFYYNIDDHAFYSMRLFSVISQYASATEP